MRSIALICVLCAVLSGCSESQCENVPLQRITSPDGVHVATLFSRSCDATTPFVQVVKISKKGADESADDSRDHAFTMRGEHTINFQWIDSGHLRITRPNRAEDIFKEESISNGLRITYKSPAGKRPR